MAIRDNSSQYRLYFATMIFAFLWVIIGDLVAMHIRVIAGVDLFGCHQPFAKTHKEQKNFKVKNYKTAGNSNISGALFNKEGNAVLKPFFKVVIIKSDITLDFDIQEYSSQITLRGPPKA